MQVSLAWLREILGPGNWVGAKSEGLAPGEYSRELAARLTMAGLEVETVTARRSAAGRCDRGRSALGRASPERRQPDSLPGGDR